MRYKKRDEFVEAVQWAVGMEHDGVMPCGESSYARHPYCCDCGKKIKVHGQPKNLMYGFRNDRAIICP
ncbi:hypothetical protein LCGC14_2982260, partial [marine sediment metagenome]